MPDSRKTLRLSLACLSVILSIVVNLYATAQGLPEAPPLADDPILEQKVKSIAEELRCLVCQNETIAGSHAELAQDLRSQIREKLLQQQSKQEIIDYMVARYGDFVLYKPPFKATTYLLWCGPFIFLIFGFLLLKQHTRQLKMLSQNQLSQEDLVLAEALLVTQKIPSATTKDNV